MKVEIKVPAMGESITEATVGTILKPSGSSVAVDDEILELETDKVNQVLYAAKSGVIHFSVNEDDVVKIGQVLGHIDTESASVPVTPAAATEKTPEPTPTTAIPEQRSEENARHTKEAFLMDLMEKPQQTKVKQEPAQPVKPVGKRQETRQKMSKIRKVISQRLVEAQQTTAMLTTFNEVDLTEVINLRHSYQDTFLKKHQVKLGFMSFFVKAAVAALEAIPDVNSYIDGEEIVHRDYFDIGIAVSSERGLVVPVIRDCDKKSFAQIESEINTYAEKARKGGLTVDDLHGGGFTITNGGIFGSLLSTPILNPPQCGILGMHKIMKRPVVIDDEIVVRSMMYLALSYDHRLIDGKEAVTFLVHIKNALEDPSRLLLDI